MKQRPILVAVIGYIIGILWGLYFRFSIVLFYIPILAIYFIYQKYFKIPKKRQFKLLSWNRYNRYLKLIINRKVIFILFMFSIFSNSIVLSQNNSYENCYQEGEQLQTIGIVVSQKQEKQYYNLYQIKILNSNHLNMYIQVQKNQKNLEYGDKVKLQGEYQEPSEQRNYGGYHDKQYLKTLKIVGRIKVNQIEVIEKEQLNPIVLIANKIKLKIKEGIETSFEKEKASLLKGLLLGETGEIPEESKEDFRISNISHVLAISGMHISYLIVGVQFILKRMLGKKKIKVLTIIVLIVYTFITGFSPSIVRAVVMGIITIGAGLVYRKSDIWNSIAISLLGILIYNPFLILNIGLQLSYLGVIGIILFRVTILKILKWIRFEKIREILAVGLSAQIVMFPILIYHFNIVGIYFLVTNVLVSFVIAPIIILGFFSVVIFLIFNHFPGFLCVVLHIELEVLTWITQFSKLPFSKIYLATPHFIYILLYYIGIGMFQSIYLIYQMTYLTTTQKRVKNLIALFRYKRKQKKKYPKCILSIFLVIIIISYFPKELKIYFVDVGQGDCTLLVTPHNKTILIDGGGSLTEQFDVGKKTLIPYLLDRGYTSLDYIMISHFDQDHVDGLLTVMEELKVKKVFMARQKEESENFQIFLETIKRKNIKVKAVKAGDRITFEKNLYMDILWPTENLSISENPLNNNSIVGKVTYKNFSILFTGDIEAVAEKAILKRYEKNNTILKSTVLKVAHHGSKTSSTKEFLEVVAPKISLIGVGSNNNFGHPSEETLENLKQINCEIHRTDEEGEITLKINKCINLTKAVNNTKEKRKRRVTYE